MIKFKKICYENKADFKISPDIFYFPLISEELLKNISPVAATNIYFSWNLIIPHDVIKANTF